MWVCCDLLVTSLSCLSTKKSRTRLITVNHRHPITPRLLAIVYISTIIQHKSLSQEREVKGKLGANAMKRVAAGAHLPTTWHFVPAKRPDDTADYCLDCSFLPPVQAPGTRFYT